MICKNCGAETYRIRMIFPEGKPSIEGCKYCIKATPRMDYRIVDDTMGFNIGVGHRDDIRSRKVDVKTGEIYKDTKKTYHIGGN